MQPVWIYPRVSASSAVKVFREKRYSARHIAMPRAGQLQSVPNRSF